METTIDNKFQIAINRSNKKINKISKNLSKNSTLNDLIIKNIESFKKHDYLTANNKIEYINLENKSYQAAIITIFMTSVTFLLTFGLINSFLLRMIIHISLFHRLFVLISYINYMEYYFSVDRVMNYINTQFNDILPITNTLDSENDTNYTVDEIIDVHKRYLYILNEINSIYKDIDTRYQVISFNFY